MAAGDGTVATLPAGDGGPRDKLTLDDGAVSGPAGVFERIGDESFITDGLSKFLSFGVGASDAADDLRIGWLAVQDHFDAGLHRPCKAVMLAVEIEPQLDVGVVRQVSEPDAVRDDHVT